MSTETTIETAIDYIDACRVDAKRYIYYADETSRWYLTTGESLEDLAEYLTRDEWSQGDAYSHWCAGDTGAIELDTETHDADEAIAEARGWL